MSPPSPTLVAGPVVAGAIVLILGSATLFVVHRRGGGSLPDVTPYDVRASRAPQLDLTEPAPQMDPFPLASDATRPPQTISMRDCDITASPPTDEDRVARMAEQDTQDGEAREEECSAPRTNPGNVRPTVGLDMRGRPRTMSIFDAERLMEMVTERMENSESEQRRESRTLSSWVPRSEDREQRHIEELAR